MPLRPPAGFVSSFYDPLKNPNAPTVGTASAGDQSASVTFTAPSNVGGSAITNYYAVSNPGQITASSVTSPVTVTGLTNGTNYTFTVWALNSFGPSAYSAASGSVTPSPPYIEDVFSTWLYTGNGTSQTITNGIDLSTKGGLVWMKDRSTFYSHALFDTVRGGTSVLATNLNEGASPFGSISGITFNSNGFYLPDNNSYGWTNTNNTNYASWTFRKQPKFFDVVTYTGNGTAGRTVAHNLGSVPGCIIIKQTSASGQGWPVYHRSEGSGRALLLNDTAASFLASGYWSNTTPTSTQFTLGSSAAVNENGQTYVAYLFAHNAGGFGLTGTDNVISCGSYTGSGFGTTVSLGYEPQWLLIKRSSEASNWHIVDNMRGFTVGTGDAFLFPNADAAENTSINDINPTATGFVANSSFDGAGVTYIYIAIRRGPMKTPTTGTSVFSPIAVNNSAGTTNTTNFPIDFQWYGNRDGTANNIFTIDRLRGVSTTSSGQQNYLSTSKTNAEVTSGGSIVSRNWNNTGFQTSTAADGANAVYWNLQRAPGFFDVVCYTGNNVNNRQLPHNLGVVPELVINKSRSNPTIWYVWVNGVSPTNKCLILNLTLDWASGYNTGFQSSTSTNLNISTASGEINISGETYVAYLFATCPGVSKVGSYTGTGALQTINCGFTGGARFVLIKRTDSTGDWFTYDSARGITSGNDPYLLMNSTAAEVTGTNYVDTTSVGFQVTAAAPAGLNANGGTYIFLAIA